MGGLGDQPWVWGLGYMVATQVNMYVLRRGLFLNKLEREKIRRHEKLPESMESKAKKTQHTENIRALGVKNQQKH